MGGAKIEHAYARTRCPLCEDAELPGSVLSHALMKHWEVMGLLESSDEEWVLDQFRTLNLNFLSKFWGLYHHN